jgi:hypothetical protein
MGRRIALCNLSSWRANRRYDFRASIRPLIDAATTVIAAPTLSSQLPLINAAKVGFNLLILLGGAPEGIRTLKPNLGAVSPKDLQKVINKAVVRSDAAQRTTWCGRFSIGPRRAWRRLAMREDRRAIRGRRAEAIS